jgi:hypothetical protein
MENFMDRKPSNDANAHAQQGSIFEAQYERDLAVWVDVCQKIIARNPNVQPPPMPQRDEYGQQGSFYEARYERALEAWQSIWG